MVSGRRAAGAIALLALLLFGWTHRHAFGLGGFADDLGLLSDMSRRAQDGGLFADAAAKWGAPLWPGAAMWRPWAYGSFALDAALWGYAPGLWRLTNLLLHLATAALTGLVAMRLLGSSTDGATTPNADWMVGATAFAVFLLAPWAPEVTLWLAGRFDAWASFGVALALWAALRSRGLDRWFGLSLAAGALAHASKESAQLLPAWLLLIAVAQRFGGSKARSGAGGVPVSWLLVPAHIALAALVFMWRARVLGGTMISVYGQSPTTAPLELLRRVFAHTGFADGLLPLAPVAGWTAVFCAIALAALAVVRARRVALLGLLFAASVLAALALYFAAPPGANEGYRLYYLATVGIAIALAGALHTHGTPGPARLATPALLLALVLASALWQARVAAEWTRASRQIQHAALATRATLAGMAPGDYGLLLLPDAAGRVPMLRNAQGVLLPATRDGRRMLDHLVVFTPPQLAEWQKLAGEEVVPKLTARPGAPPRPTRYFCHSMQREQLVDLGYWAPATDWPARWRGAAAAAGCSI